MFFIFIGLLLLQYGAGESQQKFPIGTVLFTESDNNKECWSTENLGLLTSRMLLEDVLPSGNVLVIKDNGYVNDLIEYFQLLLETVRMKAMSKGKHVMMLALTDILGGYLNHLVVPIAKHAFYAGYVDFASMDRLYTLFDELKCFLRTNGKGWATPVANFSTKMNPTPLPIPSPSAHSEPCKNLIVMEQGDPKSLSIPMPFFDSKSHPSSIAVPFKSYSLRNLEAKSASYLVVKYYLAGMKCLIKRSATPKSVMQFKVNMYAFIRLQIKPLLKHDKFYAAFGGVLRIEEALIRSGVEKVNEKQMGNYDIVREQQIPEKDFEEGVTKKKKGHFILWAIFATIFLWFLLCTLFICYRMRSYGSCKSPICTCAGKDKRGDGVGDPQPGPWSTSTSTNKTTGELPGTSSTSLSASIATSGASTPTPVSKKDANLVVQYSTYDDDDKKGLFMDKYRLTSSSEEMRNKESIMSVLYSYELESSSESSNKYD